MMNTPNWVKPVATTVAVLVLAVLIAGIVTVAWRSTRPPEGYDQSRVHWNTKNTTRFAGKGLPEVAARVARAVYPATQPENTPELVILYSPQDWPAGLAAASLLRPLKAVLLPAEGDMTGLIEQLAPSGSPALDGARILQVGAAGDGAGAALAGADTRTVEEIYALRMQLSPAPRHALVVDPDDPGSALLAAPWAAYSGDLVLFDPAAAPEGLPFYILGETPGAEAAAGQIRGRSAAHTAVAFAQYEDPQNPFFGWGFNANSTTGYRGFSLARPDDPALALLSANLAVRGKPGPLLWAGERELPQVVNNYLWSQRAAFWVTPAEGPFHHTFILGSTGQIAFPAQGQADYAVEIGPYRGKGAGMSGVDMVAAAWVALGLASAAWIAFHASKFLPGQNWVLRLAWPLMATLIGPFGIPLYYLAYNRPVIHHGQMQAWDRPLWLQGLTATVSAVGFGAAIMVATGYVATFLGLPLVPGRGPLYFLGTPMILVMVINYVVAVLVSWLLFQTPMLAMFYGLSYRQTLLKALPMVLISMTAAALAMDPGMWWLMMSNLPMMPTEESILWFGVMFFTAFLALLMAWPVNYLLVRLQRKSGLM